MVNFLNTGCSTANKFCMKVCSETGDQCEVQIQRLKVELFHTGTASYWYCFHLLKILDNTLKSTSAHHKKRAFMNSLNNGLCLAVAVQCVAWEEMGQQCCSAFFVQVQLVDWFKPNSALLDGIGTRCALGACCAITCIQKGSKYLVSMESKKQLFGSSFSTIGGQCSFLLHWCIFCRLPIGLTHGPAIHTRLGRTELLAQGTKGSWDFNMF